jgi:hypothetical protein
VVVEVDGNKVMVESTVTEPDGDRVMVEYIGEDIIAVEVDEDAKAPEEVLEEDREECGPVVKTVESVVDGEGSEVKVSEEEKGVDDVDDGGGVEVETLEGDEEADEDCEVEVKTLEEDEEDELELDEDEVELETEVTELEVEVEPDAVEPDAVDTLEELEEMPVTVDIEIEAPDGSGVETPTESDTNGDISTTTPSAEGTVAGCLLRGLERRRSGGMAVSVVVAILPVLPLVSDFETFRLFAWPT